MATRDPTDSAANYNEAASLGGWPSLCDGTLKFAHPHLVELLAVWREKAGAGGIPERSAMSPRVLKPFLRDIAIYEQVESGDLPRYRVRLFGSAFAHAMGNLTGKFIDEAIPAALLPRWHASLGTTLASRAPLRFVSRSDTNNRSFLVGEYFSAPLLAADGSVSMVLGAGFYDGSRPWRDVEASERAALSLA
jgi:hypothetical protein